METLENAMRALLLAHGRMLGADVYYDYLGLLAEASPEEAVRIIKQYVYLISYVMEEVAGNV